MLRRFVIVTACLLVVGCATNQGAQTSVAKSALTPPTYVETSRFYLVGRSDVKCRKQRRTGTHFLTWSCVSKEQEEAEFAATQAQLQKRMRNQGF